MRLIDIVNGPWAILSDTHAQVQDIYRRHLKGDKINLKDLGVERRDPLTAASLVSASAGREAEQRGGYSVIDNVAVIPVHDVIAKRMTWVMEICGGCSTQILERDFADAQADPSVKGIILYLDTPGGTVDGTAEAAALIASYKGSKPVVGFSDGMICSAGFWLAAPCDEIYISSDTNPIGSIGVVAGHVDVSEQELMSGRRVTEITAGDYKRVASGYSPLTEEGRAYIQGQLDHIYTSFTDFVAAQRGLDLGSHAEWANGRVFLGSQAIAAGLVDGVSTLGAIIDKLSGQKTGQQFRIKPTGTGAVAVATKLTEEVIMTREELEASNPELCQQLLDEGKASAAADNAEAIAQATAAERASMVALVSAGFDEETGKKLAAAADKGLSAQDISDLGISFAPVAAPETNGSAADADSRAKILAEMQSGGQEPLGSIAPEGQDEGFLDKVASYRQANACGQGTAMKAVAKSDPALHADWLQGKK
jgi:signal peptide peptidase SppA